MDSLVEHEVLLAQLLDHRLNGAKPFLSGAGALQTIGEFGLPLGANLSRQKKHERALSFENPSFAVYAPDLIHGDKCHGVLSTGVAQVVLL